MLRPIHIIGGGLAGSLVMVMADRHKAPAEGALADAIAPQSAMIDALTPSSQPSASPPASSSISINES